MKNPPQGKGEHCCYDMNLALNWHDDLKYDTRDAWYTLNPTRGSCGTSINFCPFCGSVLPGAFVTDWEKHEECDACHWEGKPDNRPECICSQDYEELKEIQDAVGKNAE